MNSQDRAKLQLQACPKLLEWAFIMFQHKPLCRVMTEGKSDCTCGLSTALANCKPPERQ